MSEHRDVWLVPVLLLVLLSVLCRWDRQGLRKRIEALESAPVVQLEDEPDDWLERDR